jgi:hypothetical protein
MLLEYPTVDCTTGIMEQWNVGLGCKIKGVYEFGELQSFMSGWCVVYGNMSVTKLAPTGTLSSASASDKRI